MAIKHLIVALITFSATIGGETNNELYFNNFEELHEGDSCEMIISAKLLVLNTDINSKFEAMKQDIEILKKKIPDNIENKLDIVEKKNHDLERAIHEKLNKLEKNIIDRFEEYIDGKLDSLGKHIYRKIDAQEKIMPDKSDIKIISHKLDELKKKQSDSDEITSQPKKLSNEPLVNTNEEISKKLNEIQMDVFEIKNATSKLEIRLDEYSGLLIGEEINKTFYAVGKHISETKNISTLLNHDSLNHELKRFQENLNLTRENIIQKLDAQNYKRVAQLENMDHQYDTIENSIRNLTEKLTCKLDTSTLAHIQNIDQKLTDMEKNMLKNDSLPSLENRVKAKSRAECKKRVTRGYGFEPLSRMDSSLMNNIKLSKDSDGNVVNFEMKIGIKGPADALIQLSPVPNPKANDFHYEIGIGGYVNKMTYFRYKDHDELPAYANTPNILSKTEYRNFLIKLSAGTLELFREGSNTPLLNRSDVRFKTFKYFGFSSWHLQNELTFLFDC